MKKQIKSTLTFQNLTEQIKGTLKHLRFLPDLDLKGGGLINSNTVVVKPSLIEVSMKWINCLGLRREGSSLVLSHLTVGYHPVRNRVQKKIRFFFTTRNMDLTTMVYFCPVNSDTHDLFKKNPIEKY